MASVLIESITGKVHDVEGVHDRPRVWELFGDARHRQMMDHQAHQRPAHRRTRKLHAWIGRCTHVLTPHVSTLLAAVAAHAHVQHGGVPPVGYVSQAPNHRVTYDALTPTLSAPAILTHYLAGQDGPIVSYTLTYHFQS